MRPSWPDRLPCWTRRLAAIGARPDEGEDERLRKASLVLIASLIIPLAVPWGVTYAVLGLWVSAAIPFFYQMVTVLGLVMLARTGGFTRFATGQLALMLVLPALLQWSLGGFSASSVVITWSLVAPLGALVFSTRPLLWFLAYLALIVLSGLIDPYLTPASIPARVNLAFFVLTIGAMPVVVYAMLAYFTRGLAVERLKSETLLLNVLPAPIARRLKTGERPLADRFDEVAVLFADLVGFTPLSERLEPEEVVDLLDRLFSTFDEMAERRRLEKIKTIGDAYMVVGGLPVPRPDAAEAVAAMALEMQEHVAGYRTGRGDVLRLRIGIDVGPVVAGVIGTRKFSYDLWGDTVNTASRMESHGAPSQIQVTGRARDRLAHAFRFEDCEPVEVKGKGTVIRCLMVGRSGDTASPVRPNGTPPLEPSTGP
ncbi:MAG: adenylate/guanylate cyclase domain-containing protein [Acidimicrobiia bacterium]